MRHHGHLQTRTRAFVCVCEWLVGSSLRKVVHFDNELNNKPHPHAFGKHPPAPRKPKRKTAPRGSRERRMNEIGHKPAHTVTELASARQHQKPANHHGARVGGAPSTVRPLARDPRVLIGWPFPLGFGLDGRLLLARRGRVYV